MRFPAEPFRIKVVEKIRRTTRDEREQLLQQEQQRLQERLRLTEQTGS